MLILTLALGQFGCSKTEENQTGENMFGLFRKDDSVENFWMWFSENEKTYRNFQRDPEKYLNEILAKVKKISGGLSVELEPPKDGVINMTISADGVSDLFPIVQKTIEKSPKINGWNFYAFRQRMPVEKIKDMTLTVKGYTLDPNKMKFMPLVSGNTLDIIIFVDDINDVNENQIAYGGLIILDNLLGEYDCVKAVRSYDFHVFPTDPKQLAELKPLIEIAKYIDDFRLRKNWNAIFLIVDSLIW